MSEILAAITPYASQKKYRATHKETVKEVNRRYYLKNKAKLQQARRTRYHEIEKPTAARKEFMETLS